MKLNVGLGLGNVFYVQMFCMIIEAFLYEDLKTEPGRPNPIIHINMTVCSLFAST